MTTPADRLTTLEIRAAEQEKAVAAALSSDVAVIPVDPVGAGPAAARTSGPVR